MHWLLEPDVFGEDLDPFIDSLASLNEEYTLVQFGKPYHEYIKHFNNTPDLIFIGSLQFGKILQYSGFRGVICNADGLACQYYYPRIGSYLLNSDYVMLPVGSFNARKSFLRSVMGDNLFVRPDTVWKSFTGGCFVHPVASDFGYLNPETLLLISTAKKPIKYEWRCIVANKKNNNW